MNVSIMIGFDTCNALSLFNDKWKVVVGLNNGLNCLTTPRVDQSLSHG